MAINTEPLDTAMQKLETAVNNSKTPDKIAALEARIVTSETKETDLTGKVNANAQTIAELNARVAKLEGKT